jgi:hypothetical protein
MASKALVVQAPIPRQPKTRLVVNPSKLVTVRTSLKVRCLRHTGLTNLSGDNMPMVGNKKYSYSSAGVSAAKKEAKKTGMKMSSSKKKKKSMLKS